MDRGVVIRKQFIRIKQHKWNLFRLFRWIALNLMDICSLNVNQDVNTFDCNNHHADCLKFSKIKCATTNAPSAFRVCVCVCVPKYNVWQAFMRQSYQSRELHNFMTSFHGRKKKCATFEWRKITQQWMEFSSERRATRFEIEILEKVAIKSRSKQLSLSLGWKQQNRRPRRRRFAVSDFYFFIACSLYFIYSSFVGFPNLCDIINFPIILHSNDSKIICQLFKHNSPCWVLFRFLALALSLSLSLLAVAFAPSISCLFFLHFFHLFIYFHPQHKVSNI